MPRNRQGLCVPRQLLSCTQTLLVPLRRLQLYGRPSSSPWYLGLLIVPSMSHSLPLPTKPHGRPSFPGLRERDPLSAASSTGRTGAGKLRGFVIAAPDPIRVCFLWRSMVLTLALFQFYQSFLRRPMPGVWTGSWPVPMANSLAPGMQTLCSFKWLILASAQRFLRRFQWCSMVSSYRSHSLFLWTVTLLAVPMTLDSVIHFRISAPATHIMYGFRTRYVRFGILFSFVHMKVGLMIKDTGLFLLPLQLRL